MLPALRKAVGNQSYWLSCKAISTCTSPRRWPMMALRNCRATTLAAQKRTKIQIGSWRRSSAPSYLTLSAIETGWTVRAHLAPKDTSPDITGARRQAGGISWVSLALEVEARNLPRFLAVVVSALASVFA